MLQRAPKVGQTETQYAAGLLTITEPRLRKVQTASFTISNKVFYKKLEEGTCKIVDVNIILLA